MAFGYPGQPRIIDNFTLTVGRDSRIAIMGPSGGGKTTLLRILAGLLPPSRGERSLGGEVPRVGMLPQDDPFLPWRTVRRNLDLLKDGSLNEIELSSILNSVGLESARYAHRYPGALSGGERRRLGLAMVLASRPDLMLLDEAGTSLDEGTRFAIVDEILRTVRRLPASLIAITHDVEEALLLGDVLLICRGAGYVEHRSIALPADRTSEIRFEPEFQALRADVVASLRQ